MLLHNDALSGCLTRVDVRLGKVAVPDATTRTVEGVFELGYGAVNVALVVCTLGRELSEPKDLDLSQCQITRTAFPNSDITRSR